MRARKTAAKLIQRLWRRRRKRQRSLAERLPHQRKLKRWRKHPLYVFCLLRMAELGNFLALVIELQIDPDRSTPRTWDFIETAFLCIFLCDIALKVYAHYPDMRRMKPRWLHLILVTVGWLRIILVFGSSSDAASRMGTLYDVLRLMRAVRLLPVVLGGASTA